MTAQRRRYAWLAVLLTLVLSPFFSMLYLGRGWRAIFYLVLSFVLVLGAVLVSSDRLIAWSAAAIVAMAGAIESYEIAQHYREAFSGGWYSRWYGICGIYVAFAVLALCVQGCVVR